MRINLNKTLAFCAFFLFGGLLMAQTSFSGTVEMVTIDTKVGDRSNVTLQLSGTKARVNIVSNTKDGESVFSILARVGEPGLTMLSEMGGQQIFMRLPDPVPGGSHAYPVFDQVWVESGTKMIAGHECKRYSLTGNGFSATAYVAIIPGLSNTNIPTGFTFNGILPALKTKGIVGIPLEYVINSSEGGMVVSQETISVRAEEFMTSNFEIPSGFEDGNKVWEESAAGK